MIRTKAQSMQDQPNRMFDLWLKDQIELIQLDDSTFTQKVLEKIQSAEKQASTLPDAWTNWSWILCTMTLGSVLAQYLTQIDTDTFTGPVVESLILLIAMMGVAWQCQRTWVQSH